MTTPWKTLRLDVRDVNGVFDAVLRAAQQPCCLLALTSLLMKHFQPSVVCFNHISLTASFLCVLSLKTARVSDERGPRLGRLSETAVCSSPQPESG